MIKDKLETATERCLEKIYQPASSAARHGLEHKSLFFVSLLFVFFVFSIGHIVLLSNLKRHGEKMSFLLFPWSTAGECVFFLFASCFTKSWILYELLIIHVLLVFY